MSTNVLTLDEFRNLARALTSMPYRSEIPIEEWCAGPPTPVEQRIIDAFANRAGMDWRAVLSMKGAQE